MPFYTKDLRMHRFGYGGEGYPGTNALWIPRYCSALLSRLSVQILVADTAQVAALVRVQSLAVSLHMFPSICCRNDGKIYVTCITPQFIKQTTINLISNL